MTRTAIVIALMATLLPTATVSAQEGYDAAASASLSTWAETLFATFYNQTWGDVAIDTEELTFWDVGDEGPWERRGAEAWTYLQGSLAEITAAGITWELILTAANCHAMQGLGYCAVEFMSFVHIGDLDIPPAPWRASLVARQVDGVWTLVHFHNTLAGTAEAE